MEAPKGTPGNFGADGIVHFKWLQFIAHKLYFSKVDF